MKKKIIALVLIVAVLAGAYFTVGRNIIGGNKSKTYRLGETISNDDVQFTLEKYRYVEEVEGTCLNPDNFYNTHFIQRADQGCQLVYLEYSIKNENIKQVRNGSNIRVHLKYGKGYEFGVGTWDKDYFDKMKGPHLGKISCDEIDPLAERGYRHIIKNAPQDISKSNEKISIIVNLMGKEFEYVIREDN